MRFGHFYRVLFRVVTGTFCRNVLGPFLCRQFFAPRVLFRHFYSNHHVFRHLDDLCRAFNHVKPAIWSRVLCPFRRVDEGVHVRRQDDEVCGARVRALASDIVGGRNVRHLASVIVSARKRQRITRTAASIYAKRVLFSPSNDLSGVRHVVVVFLGAHDRDRCVEIRGSVVEVGVRLFYRCFVDANASFGLAFGDVYLSFFVRDRRCGNDSRFFCRANVFCGCLLPFLREGEVSGKLSLRTFRSNLGSFPLKEIGRGECANCIKFKRSRVRRDDRLLPNIRRAIVRVCVGRRDAIFRLLTDSA